MPAKAGTHDKFRREAGMREECTETTLLFLRQIGSGELSWAAASAAVTTENWAPIEIETKQ